MHRVDKLLDYLAGRPASCSTCGSVLVAIAGRDLLARTCPRCDVTPGARPPTDDARVPHAKLHFTEIPGCHECVERRRMRA